MAISPTFRTILRALATSVSIAGVLLLAWLLVQLANGSLTERVLPGVPGSVVPGALALALTFPVPFHVFSIGLILQRRWLSAAWGRAAWICIVTSGLWLGVALAVKLMVLA